MTTTLIFFYEAKVEEEWENGKIDEKGSRKSFELMGAAAQNFFTLSPSSHYGSKHGEIETLDYTLSHKLWSEQSNRASE